MIVAQFMHRLRQGIDRMKGTGRLRTTYRAARRNIAKINYRHEKCRIAAAKKVETKA